MVCVCVFQKSIKITIPPVPILVLGVGSAAKHFKLLSFPQNSTIMNTPSVQVALEHGAWFGNLIDLPRPVQKEFVDVLANAHGSLSVGESVQHIYTTLGILQQALYEVIDADLSPKLGTWKKRDWVCYARKIRKLGH